MMKFDKAPPWLVSAFDGWLGGTVGVRRVMFGYPAGFLHGNMFCGVFGKSLFVRLGEADREALLREEGASTLDPMGGRPMREYVVVPPDLLDDDAAMRGWMARAVAYAQTLPPKAKAVTAAKKPGPKKKPATKSPKKRA